MKAAALLALLALASGCGQSLAGEKRLRHTVEVDYGITDPQFKRDVEHLLGARLVEGNKVEEILNGDRIFNAMVLAIQKAEKSVTLEMYIWSSGKVSDTFIAAFVERAKAGVRTHIVIDGVGSARLSRKDREKLTDAGVQLEVYNSLLSFNVFRANYRTHRKLLVVDGKVGFVGGICISDDWRGDAQPPFWRDTMIRIEGPVVPQIQAVFMDNWAQTHHGVLTGEGYFPKVARAGGAAAQAIQGGPREDAENIRLAFMLSIAAARKNIRIANAYFLPDEHLIEALLAAQKRGVKIEVMVAGKSDNPAVTAASKPRWGKLLKEGILFHEYGKTLFHPKIMIVNDVWSMVGSANIDDRSMRLNDEDLVNVYDEAFAKKMVATFEADKKDCRPMKEGDLKKRFFLLRWLNHLAGLFRPLM